MQAFMAFFAVLSGIGSLFMGGDRRIAEWRKENSVRSPVLLSSIGSWGMLAVVLNAGFSLHWPFLILAIICLSLIGWGIMAARAPLDKASIPFRFSQNLGTALVSGSFMVLLFMTAISGFVGFIQNP